MNQAGVEDGIEGSAVFWGGPARAQGGVYKPGFTTVQEVDRTLRRQYATGITNVDQA
jgi:hypothetical protein